jgi:hypothetical protein
MLINDKSKIQKNISGIHKYDMELIKAFLQGAVYCWIKNKKEGRIFALRSLVGGENSNWINTPLEPLYEKHRKMGKDKKTANKVAGQDAGKILKLVLHKDKRKFKVSDAGLTNGYKWIK